MINEIASILLWLIVAIFFLHVIEGNAQDWIKSKFQRGVPNDIVSGDSAGNGQDFSPSTTRVTKPASERKY